MPLTSYALYGACDARTAYPYATDHISVNFNNDLIILDKLYSKSYE